MSSRCVVIRTPSGLSGDMFVAGLAVLAGATTAELRRLIGVLNVPCEFDGISLDEHAVSGIYGHKVRLRLPSEESHRSWNSIRTLILNSKMSSDSQALAIAAFELLAEIEGRVHGVPADSVTFHEVGALDSIVDICLTSMLFDQLSPDRLVCSPLPIGDGVVRCAHGLLMSPPPAVQEMLVGIPIYGVDSVGETVTPTAIALLRALQAEFGMWPSMDVERVARVYGDKVFRTLPNGALFALGALHPSEGRGVHSHQHHSGHSHD